MSIRQIEIKNFQSHLNTVLKFHKGVNVIVGASDRGKSSILRSLGWVIRNRVEDKSFRSRWGGATDVEITFADDLIVSRVQDNGNAYYLQDVSGNIDQEYKAFRTDIPDDILEALNMDSVNIASQFDPPFLLADSASDVAKTLNKLANLTDIDTSISNVRKLLLANTKDISATEATLANLNEKKLELSYIGEMEKDVLEFEKTESELSQLKTTIPVLELLITKQTEYDKNLDLLSSFLKAEVELVKGFTLVDSLVSLTDTIGGLTSLVDIIDNLEMDSKEIDDLLLVEADIIEGLHLVTGIQILNDSTKLLQQVTNCVEKNELDVKYYADEIDNKELEFKTAFPSVCPLCSQEVQ